MKWILLTIIGAILTPMAHELATTQRGYHAIGGEFFIIPLILIIAVVIEQLEEIRIEFNKVFSECEEEKTSSTGRC